MSTWRNYSAKTSGGVRGRQTDSDFLYAPLIWCHGDTGCYGRGARKVRRAQLSGGKLYGFSMLDEDGGFLFSVFPSYLQYLDQRLKPEGDLTQCVVSPEAL